MKTRNIILLVTVLMVTATSCVKEIEKNGVYSTTEYTGIVLQKKNRHPLVGAQVRVTDGRNIYASTTTDGSGIFSLEVNFDKVTSDSYLWIDGSSINMPSTIVALKGAYQQKYDYGVLTVGLPTFSHNGHTYMVAPDPHYSDYNSCLSWSAANAYCNNLTAYGYSDWRMPSIEELETMYLQKENIGGFINTNYDSYDYRESYYWSSSINPNNTSLQYLVYWYDGSRYSDYDIERTGSWSTHRAHVRPIRMDY